jgi:hypothetical protein
MLKKILLLLIIVCITNFLKAQSDAENTSANETEYAEKVFNTAKLNNSQTTELFEKGKMQFLISHVMGNTSLGYKELWGFYQATSRLSLDLGITNKLSTGIAIHTNKKLFDGYLKYSIFRQSTGYKNFPVNIVWYSAIALNTSTLNYPEDKTYLSARTSYTHQLLISRKFNENLSIQITPTVLHRNMVSTPEDHNTTFASGFLVKYKIGRKASLIGDYFWVPSGQIYSYNRFNSLSFGIEIVTSKRHAFQIFLTNSTGMDDMGSILDTREKFNPDGWHIGFNISTLFTLFQNNE